MALLATACGNGSTAASAVASAEHCGGEQLTPTLATRLSRYSAGIPSTTMHVVQLCHPGRGCSAVAEYHRGRPPIAELSRDRLRLIIPMVSRVRVFRETVWVNGREIPLEVVPWPIRTEEDVRKANVALGLPPDSRGYLSGCATDLAPRPYATEQRRTPSPAA